MNWLFFRGGEVHLDEPNIESHKYYEGLEGKIEYTQSNVLPAYDSEQQYDLLENYRPSIKSPYYQNPPKTNG